MSTQDSPKRPAPLDRQSVLKNIESKAASWELLGEGANAKISRRYDLKDFDEAMAFLSKIAVIAREMNHHPEIYNCYSTLRLELSTHDTQPQGGGVSDWDINFAQRADRAFEAFVKWIA